MSREEHIKYIDELNELQDREGKRIAGSYLKAFKKLLNASNGDVRKFLKMVEVLKKKMMKEGAQEIRKALIEAKKTGDRFGSTKI